MTSQSLAFVEETSWKNINKNAKSNKKIIHLI